MKQITIGLFDSGIGGTSIVDAIQLAIPQAKLVYCADYARFPYGASPDEVITAACLETIKQLFITEPLDLLVIACSTASTLVLDQVRASLPIPIVGVVPAIKPAAAISQTQEIAILATKATIRRAYTKELIEQFAGNSRVHLIGSQELVQEAERKMSGLSPSLERITQELALIHAHKAIDTVVLACTHFPLLKEELSLAAGRTLNWLEPGPAIAQRIITLLGLQQQINETVVHPSPPHCCYITGDTIPDSIKCLTKRGFNQSCKLDLKT